MRNNYVRRFTNTFLLLMIVILACDKVSSQNLIANGKVATTRSPFRYVIVTNEVEPAISRADKARRIIEILLDKKAFSKENLVTLFNLISKRFPQPDLLYVSVLTDLEDIETPEEADQGKLSETSDCIGLCQQDSATFIGNSRKGFFYIYFADGRFEEVEIK